MALSRSLSIISDVWKRSYKAMPQAFSQRGREKRKDPSLKAGDVEPLGLLSFSLCLRHFLDDTSEVGSNVF
jgi:hypothetical protein